MLTFEITTWLLWGAVGVVMALIYSWMYGAMSTLVYDLIVGVACSIAGGWGIATYMGAGTESQLIISVLTSVFAGALGLYLLNKIMFRDHED